MNYKSLAIIATLLVVMMLLFHQCTKVKVVPNICFSRDILPVFVSKCSTSGCHDGGSSGGHEHPSGNFTTYEGIINKVKPYYPLLSDVYVQSSGRNPSMPPQGSVQLTTAELETIKYWIHVGAKNEATCKSSCDTINVTYSGKIKPLMDTWCLGCHSGSNPGGGYNFSTYEGVKNSISPDNRLLGSINHLSGYKAMPQGVSMLDNCDIRAIELWINDNSPNN